MTYAETLDFLYTQLPMYSRIGAAAYKKDLTNIIALCDAIGHPQQKFKSIHVAGTNGKGSTSHMLAAVLQQSGFKTGLYTSPHIYDFRERIRINGIEVEEGFVVEFTQSVFELCKTLKPSFFELTVAMAFEYFAKNKVDIAVIETGLGGRLDSTNIITPVLSVITSIGLDHMELLGDSIEKIAKEKAGIIKNHIPVVAGNVDSQSRRIISEVATSNHSVCHFAEDEMLIEYIESSDALLLCHIKDLESGIVEKLNLDLTGLYQASNAATVLTAVKELRRHFTIPENSLHEALSHVKKLTGIFGRWEIVASKPLVILDVAHNKEGIMQVVSQLLNNHPAANYHFVMGFVKEKDLNGVFGQFPENSSFYFSNAHIERALPHSELKRIAGEHGLKGEGFDDVNDAITAARKAASPSDVILVCGSFFLISEVDLPKVQA